MSGQDEAFRAQITQEIRNRITLLDEMTVPLRPSSEIASRQALATLALTIDAFDLAVEQNQRIVDLTTDKPMEVTARAEALGQIGWVRIQQGQPEQAVEALRAVHEIRPFLPVPDELLSSDLYLIEALLMLGDEDGVKEVLEVAPLPGPPMDHFVRSMINDLEDRFDISLLPGEDD